MRDYGHIDDETPSLAIALFKEYRGQGIGRRLMEEILGLLRDMGYTRVSLAVQTENYAVKFYTSVGFGIVDENEEEYIMVRELED
ncbi:Acetyltransferase (GNAT) family protein [Ruminococcaceae bacterium YRB3002]|nr:Acetyltransferase (GNAT) family protein [Ruminococcaceae bacterium YRB3002]